MDKINTLPLAYKWIGLTILLFVSLSFLVFQTENFKNTDSSIQVKRDIAHQLLKLPLSFESNKGQIDPSVQFLSRRKGYSFYFTPQEIVMVIQKNSPLKIQFIGANQNPILAGVDELNSKSNYFIGNDPHKWLTNIPHYTKVSYQDIYPGINALFYGNGQQLEYDICIAPGKNPQDPHLHFEGAKELSIDTFGNLHILIDEKQEIQMQKPFVYQMVEGNKNIIDGKFILLAQNDVGFEIGSYDTTMQLVIDPVLIYSTYLGGTDNDSGKGIAADKDGNIYIIGETASNNFPTTQGSSLPNYRGNGDAFITKLNPTGSSLIYSTYLGGSDNDSGAGIAIDSVGNAYATGFTTSNNFPLQNPFQPILNGIANAFLTKLNPTGSALLYSTYLGGSAFDSGNAIAIDSTGNAYITGRVGSSDFPVTPNAFQTTLAVGAVNAFVSKINPAAAGTQSLIYSTYLGGSNLDVGFGIAVDNNGNAYVTGSASSNNFPVTPGVIQGMLLGSRNAFITKINSTGTAPLIYSTYLGGSIDDESSGIAIDSSNNAYIIGCTSSPDFPVTIGAFQTTNNGANNVFVTKINPTATSPLIYSTFLGGTAFDMGNALAIDSNGNAYVTGFTTSSDFPVTSDAFQPNFSGLSNAFFTKFNPQGSNILYSTFLGNGQTSGNSIALNGGQVYIAGTTDSVMFPTTPGVVQPMIGGGDDAFISAFLFDVSNVPIITQISPHSGPNSGGTLVTIIGIGFTGTTSVTFGSIEATSFTVISDNEISTISPPGNGTVDVRVTAHGATSQITPADQFTYGFSPSPLPPSHFKAKSIKNEFLTQTTYTHFLKWKPSSDITVVGYKLFRNGKLIATVGATGPFKYIDPHRPKKRGDIYTLVSFNAAGIESQPIRIKLKGKI